MPWGHPQCSLSWPSPGPPSPPDPPGQDELSPLSSSSVPQFPLAHRGVPAQWGIQPGNFTPQQCRGASTSSTQISACWGPREGRRDIWELQGHVPPTPALESRPCCIWHVFICHGAFLWGDNAEGMSINCTRVHESVLAFIIHAGLAPSQQLCLEPPLQTFPVPWAVNWGGC